MYYPKSHITPNLYSNGELAYKNSNVSYIGYYFSTLDNKTFTGKYPGDGDNLELTPIQDQPYSSAEEVEGHTPEDFRFYPQNAAYSKLNKVSYGKGLSQSPTPFYPQLTEQDYQLGEFTRYFSKKSNEEIYYETSDLFKNSLYIGFSLPWVISGEKLQVQKVNENIVKLKEQQYSISGLGAFLNYNYLQFYK